MKKSLFLVLLLLPMLTFSKALKFDKKMASLNLSMVLKRHYRKGQLGNRSPDSFLWVWVGGIFEKELSTLDVGTCGAVNVPKRGPTAYSSKKMNQYDDPELEILAHSSKSYTIRFRPVSAGKGSLSELDIKVNCPEVGAAVDGCKIESLSGQHIERVNDDIDSWDYELVEDSSTLSTIHTCKTNK